ncbi:MAG: response regulator [Silvanigrellales bacterium]|jgi:signal transduction histidine kinase/DNA-binding response OmpR family regulator|nr:response regulator [Silvanigrellales bacterium]
MKSARSKSLGLLLPWMSFVAVMAIALASGLQFYTQKLAGEFLESWLQSEAVAIQEGNLLTSLSKNQRVLLSSDVVEGIALLGLDQEGREVRDKPIELGSAFQVPGKGIPREAGRVHVLPAGLFQAIGVYRLPEDPTLCVAFLAHLRWAPWLLVFFVAFVGFATFLILSIAHKILSAEHETRLQVVIDALSDMVDDRPLSVNVDSFVPGISSAWSALRTRMDELKNNVARQSRLAAVARTTQALAHDVRKPFSMFKSIIQVVEATEDPSEVREVLKLTLPEVNQAMASVEGMIQDVMLIGSDTKMHTEEAAPESLVESALGELFRVYPEADVTISCEFAHRHMVHADSVRLGRVFANILGNAVQAMSEKGSLWIRTDERDEFVEFVLGNGGSAIPAESLPKLFDAFFTSGKKEGTGLGLAIAKKIVEAHGGTIRCISETNEKHPSGMVEFHFTLPMSEVTCPTRSEALPRSSREIQAALAAVRIAAARLGGSGPDPREVEIEAAILARLDSMGQVHANPVTVLVVDDEVVYRNGLLALLEQSDRLSARIRMVFAKNDEEAIAAVSLSKPILLIEDVDLGTRSRNGLEIVKNLRDSGFAGHICVHSNRFLLGDSRAALEAGADAVLPKPMGRAHFLKLILASIPETRTIETATQANPTIGKRLSVALIDDSVSQRMAWKSRLKGGTEFRAFASSGAFLCLWDSEPSYLASLDVVVTDYNFASGDPHDGGTLARELRRRGFEGLILRASGESDLGPEIEALFDGDVGKVALELPAFHAAVDNARRTQKRG